MVGVDDDKYDENSVNSDQTHKLYIADENLNQTSTENDLDDDDDEDEDNALVDIKFDKGRRKRSLIYSEGGVLIANDLNSDDVIKGTELPLEEAIRRQEIIDKKFIEEQDQEPKRANRWDFYKIIEHMTER